MSEPHTLQADYLVVGAGAMGMAFTDGLVTESRASVIVVDRHDQPGGHWNDAYAYVRLHSASANYGVNSRALGEDGIESSGLNRGFHERASAAEICSYFDRIMRQQFLPTGRVQYFPRCDYRGDGVFVELMSGTEHRVVCRKIVDATFTDTVVPSMRKPPYSIEAGVQCVTPNALPNCSRADSYIVIGAGKTGIDACLWLLEHGVPDDIITWIMPRDSWLLDRAHVEPRAGFFMQRMGAFVRQTELIEQAESVEHLFRLLSADGQLLRIDEEVVPTRYRCATVSRPELEQLRRIRNIVRLGRVERVESGRIVMNEGSIATSPGTLHIDCTASGIRSRAAVPVFDGKTITLQPVRMCQQCFSAALIAHVEVAYAKDAQKNSFCKPIPLPIRDVDWLRMFVVNMRNQYLWSSTLELRSWIAGSRLDPNYGRTAPLTDEETALTRRFRSAIGAAATKLETLLAPCVPVGSFPGLVD
jgi:hypothetical protein